MTAAHSERKHSKLGPSAAHRWMECAGSVAMSEGMPNKSTVFALEGTAAHEFNEMILARMLNPQDWLGGAVDLEAPKGAPKFITPANAIDLEIDRERYFAIDAEMVEGCEMTIETINRYYKPEEGDKLMLETRLDMSWIHPKLFGTGDMLIYKRATGHLIVMDYKYGKGIAVDVEDNEQVLTYAVGACALFAKEGVALLTCVIVQPRAFHVDGPVRVDDVDMLDLFVFEGILKERAHATDDPNAPLIAGDQCRFCPAGHACETYREFIFEEIVGVTTPSLDEPFTERHLPKLNKMTSKQLGNAARSAKLLEGWCRRMMQYAHQEALDGRVPTGMKMVDKRAYRKFTASYDDIMFALDMEGIDEDNAMTEPRPPTGRRTSWSR